VSSSDFQQIAVRAGAGKPERLFRAAVSAFCSLPRPSRREIAQLEDLTLPLFDSVSPESLRFVAAALSECEYPPAALVRRLAEERVDVAAPLLMRSRALSDIDLIALIGRHGLPHARAIARRKALNPAIAHLIRALERPTLVGVRETKSIKTVVEALPDRIGGEEFHTPTPVPSPQGGGEVAGTTARRQTSKDLPETVAPSSPSPLRGGVRGGGERVGDSPAQIRELAIPEAAGDAPGTALTARVRSGAENVRRRLRTMMRPARPEIEAALSINPFTGPDAYAKLRETALTGNAAFFQTALADALDIDFSVARSITESQSYAALLTALRALDLSEDKAFLITVAIFPRHFPRPEAIRLFLDRFRLLHRDVALDRLRGWKAEGVSRAILEAGHEAAMGAASGAAMGAANADAPVNDGRRRFGKAS
jgi:uncharacterized protein (DUF2336 family)